MRACGFSGLEAYLGRIVDTGLGDDGLRGVLIGGQLLTYGLAA
ncbi:hypothetical protein [Acrocarpospora macrocephala]|nr:hypothetical protein [Acrocarpospora macrocephala]